MASNDESVFNAELRYLAENIRELHSIAIEKRGELRFKLSPDNALAFQISIEKLIVGLIATGRYKKGKTVKNKPVKGKKVKSTKMPGNLKTQLDKLVALSHDNPAAKKAGYPELFELHTEIVVLIASENIFQKTIKDTDKIGR